MEPPLPTDSRPTTKPPQRGTASWEATTILNRNSPLVNKDIHPFLATCISGWHDNYSEEQKRAIIDSLPPRYRQYNIDDAGRLTCPISTAFVLEDTYIKAATTKFKRALKDGQYRQGWQNQARQAMQERRAGRFDDYLQEVAEKGFGDGMSGSDDQKDDQTDAQMEAPSSDEEWRDKGGKGRPR